MKNYLDVMYSKKDKPLTNYPDQLADYFIKSYHLEKGSKILDNGCGRGDFLEAFQKSDFDCYGTDIENIGIEKTYQVNLEEDRLPFEDGTFDVVFSKSVVEHISSPENYFKEMLRVLKPNGRIIIMVPNWYSQLYIFYNDITHVKPYTEKSLTYALTIFGFSEIQVEVFYQLPCAWKYPCIKLISKFLYNLGPVKKIYKNKFIRFSRETMLLGTAIKK